MTEIRPMTADDVAGMHELPMAAFREVDRAHNRPAEDWDERRIAWWDRKTRHLLATDPALQWVAVDGDEVVGSASALRRGGLWGLSLLVVRPGLQAAGLGKRLIAAALAGWEGAGIICASDDPRALRRYGSEGFGIHPIVTGHGAPDVSGLTADPRVTEGVDAGFADDVDLLVRGAPHGPDHGFYLEQPGFALRYEHGAARGYCYGGLHGQVSMLAATEPLVAQALLRAALVRQHELGNTAIVSQVSGHQQWAVRVLVETRLPLSFDGAVCYRGMAEPDAYLPSGVFL